jgi:valyl-tRNA synthetase
VPAELGTTFDALRPALERLARARPLGRSGDAGTTHPLPAGALAVVAGGLGAVILPAATDAATGETTAARDRARLQRELAEMEGLLAAARARLADERFLGRAPAHVVAGAKAREAELAERVGRLEGLLGGMAGDR